MPSGRTHDVITVLLTVPATVIAFMATQRPVAAAVVGAAFLFGMMGAVSGYFLNQMTSDSPRLRLLSVMIGVVLLTTSLGGVYGWLAGTGSRNQSDMFRDAPWGLQIGAVVGLILGVLMLIAEKSSRSSSKN